MPFSPFESFEHLKESICSYLETAYKISDRAVFAERAQLLRQEVHPPITPAVAQDPFIESTPAFPGTQYLTDLVKAVGQIPAELADLAAFGMPVRDFPLYDHQVEALQRRYSNAPNLVVATGTGSGKTEIFLLAILADILREALTVPWRAPVRPPEPGTYNSGQQQWLHRRRHERRPAAARAIVLYPMNALVNDQLQRLRRILSDSASEAWQLATLQNNLIYFGMYTGDTEPTGHWSRKARRDSWNRHIQDIATTWSNLAPEHQQRGNWPRIDGPEMICRWDIQMAPPDILVTNYSMLEYMLTRPIEAPIFELTKRWLKMTPNARLTLVLDEAHTYTGARGTEIAYLMRRLKERLDIKSGDGKLRCIATSASLPTMPTARQEIRQFAADLFGESIGSFSAVVASSPPPPPNHSPSGIEAAGFATFSESFDPENPTPAITALVKALSLDSLDPNDTSETALYKALREHPQIVRARTLTTRNAIQLDRLAANLWGTAGTPEQQRQATTGVFAAGAYAREKNVVDAPPLISSRVHMMFRGIPGLWACMDPNCSEVPRGFGLPTVTSRPVGRLYKEPTPWCKCGARVLEVFTCRVCGLMFLGGIPDPATGSLWPWADDLESGRPDLNDFVLFGVESPGSQLQYRSIRTTRLIAGGHSDARRVYEVRGAVVKGVQTPFPNECSRCHNRRGRGAEGREIIEPLRTKGSKSFSVIVEDAFRLQPSTAKSVTANHGRKALTFSDSRQDAAMLAGDLEIDHNRDLFRQMAYRLLVGCHRCLGFGTLQQPPTPLLGGGSQGVAPQPCPDCHGSGSIAGPATPIPVSDLRQRILTFAHRARINPTLDDLPSYFAQLTPFFNPNQNQAVQHINASLRNEIAAPDFGLEPMGLAAWRATFPPQVAGNLPDLTPAETDELIEAVTRLLATEDVLLPPSLDLRDWGETVPQWDRNLLVRPPGSGGNHLVAFNPTGRSKLGRFLRSVAETLFRTGRIQGANAVDQWLAAITTPLFGVLQQLGIITPDANNLGYGINIDRFQLEPVGDHVHECQACAYITNRAVLNICLRCGQETALRQTIEVRNFYRRSVGFAQPGVPYPDPFPLRVLEHSGQIEKPEARRYELRYQDVYLGNENPDDVRVDVLSVTTTMEMGIDIGNLLSVGLRNVPPTVANYQQRAGRAGRRGSAVATVLTYAQNRSHDQYYFADPPKIVTEPPRIPKVYIDNRVIAQRHVRAVVLQRFFHQWPPTASGQVIGGTLNAWGSIHQFNQNNGPQELERWVRANQLPLIDRCKLVVELSLHTELAPWVSDVPAEVVHRLQPRPVRDDILGSLLDVGYLPRHAFPLDVVSLWTESPPLGANYRERGVQRDLGIALSEFAPGAEIVRKKRIHQVVGLYDPDSFNPDFQPDGRFMECRDCHAVQLIGMAASAPIQCGVCQGIRLVAMPVVRPPGFCSEWAGPEAGGRRYLGGGRERAGTTTPARLAIGDDSFTSPSRVQPAFAPNLNVLVRVGDLHMVNRGADADHPGFRICPQCGRALGPTDTLHTFAAHIPPFDGPNRGPRAGQQCPNVNPSANNVLLGHRFPSEVVLLGTNLPLTMDADVRGASGRAIWLSFGTVVLNAAARVLQINPEELRVDIRAAARPGGRVHGEVYMYDSLPGGAGYARDVEANLEAILRQALTDSRTCSDPQCTGACYSCLLDYQNQFYHAMLDRQLGHAVLDYLLNGAQPSLTQSELDLAAARLRPYLPDGWTVLGPANVAGQYLPLTVLDSHRDRLGILPRHALQAPPDSNLRQQLLISGVRCCSYTNFDLTRRPFWVINQISTQP
jgi:ribosomal protein S27E